MSKACIACGMPMDSTDDFAMGDKSKKYCKHCCHPDGTMESYEEKLKSFTKFLIKTKGLDKIRAKEKAVEIMAELPAWKGRGT
ncbi:MAG: zinc ribbon domain-containing protein [bacterium]|nr:zinc ribbon domain-containing protein [bacterium]